MTAAIQQQSDVASHNRQVIAEALRKYEHQLTRMLTDSTIHSVAIKVVRNGGKFGQPLQIVEQR